MHARLRLATSVALLALIVAACGSSSSSPAAAATDTASPEASVPAATAPAQSTAPDVTASASASTGTAAPSASASASAAPTPTPTAEQQAVMDKLPTKIGNMDLVPTPYDIAADIKADPTGMAPLIAMLATLKVDPSKVITVGDLPKDQANQQLSFIIAAYRFPGADPAAVRTEFPKYFLGLQPGATSEETTFGGKKVLRLDAPASASLPPQYLIFDGDGVYRVSSTDSTFVTQVVQALP
jgi:hypothetical protein